MATILITGASTGLGLATAKLLHSRGHRLIVTAREQSLDRFAEHPFTTTDSVFVRPLDVTDADQRERLVREAETRWNGIDVLINNAGVAYRSVLEHVTEAERLVQFDVNFRAPMELARLVLPGMRARRRGKILNVSSVGGMMAMPTMSIYSASKFALEGASEALYYEVRPWNISVTLIEPGFINSDGFEKVRFTELGASSRTSPDSDYYAHYYNMDTFIQRIMRRAWATPESVARTIVRTVEKRRPPLRVPATLDAHLFRALRYLLPQRLYHWVLYRSLPGVRHWARLGR
ncbi:MAG TPA: SDR family oxidoreductase [Polyangiaceae bacterium]|nr:SDR family oxidoreductase [Polyangiaceae bacterium]